MEETTNNRVEARQATTEQSLILQNQVLLELAKSEAIDSGDKARAFREITEASARALGLERVGVWLYADDKKDSMSSPDLFLRSKGEHTTAPMLSHTTFPRYFSTLALERAIPADDAHTHPATAELSAAYLTPLGIGSLLDAPIRWHGKMIGLVCHEHVGPPRTWTQDEINFAGSMADQVARALESEARVKAQQALAESNRTLETRIAQRTQELEATNEQLRKLHGLKDEMFQNVSHELRTPLTLILSPVERLLEKPGYSEDDRRRLDSIRSNALRLLGLVNDVLDLAKLETARKLESNPSSFDLGLTLGQLFAEIQEPARERGLAATIDVPTGLWVRVDESHLERVVLNLISNAMKFTPAEGNISLSCTADAAEIRIAVRDTGIGIPAQSLGTIFERFRQLDGGRARQYEGTGIGLALSAELARDMGGVLRVESELHEGSTFTLVLPASLRALPSERSSAAPETAGKSLFRRAAQAQLRREVSAPSSQGDKGPLVLVVEDDPGIRRELMDLLATTNRVVGAANGEQALAVALAKTPHVVITDLMMPDMDGLELVRLLRERPELRETAIIMLSARAELDDRVRGRQLGIDTYLAKPFHPQEVGAAVEGLLRSRMRLVGRYLVHERLGSGGQSQVFRAESVDTGTEVALKIIAGAGIDDSTARDRLSKEHRALKGLVHPNIVRVFDNGVEQAGHFLSMEMVHGVTLSELVRKRGTLSVPEVISAGLAVASALQAVHEAGLLHRDIKPSNILVVGGATELGARIRLIDFGTASHLNTVLKEDSMIGTLPYMAPELFSEGSPSVASDIYALGVTLYSLAAGALPFRGRSSRELAQAIQTQSPALGPLAPAEFASVVGKAMARDPSLRYESAAELRHDLERLATQNSAAPGWIPQQHDITLQVDVASTNLDV